MERTFDINIMTGQAVVYSGKISSLIAPSVNGYLGVLADHAPLVSILKTGKITLKDATGKPVIFDVEGEGLIHVLKNDVTILYAQADGVHPVVST
jgi:F-type H+-transporting ATPase subunit epsilon